MGLSFVWMFPDSLRAESFGSYGLALPTSPHLDAFAASAVRFEQVHALHTQCSPSRAAMLSGRYLHTLGHRTQSHLLQAHEPNYFAALKRSGYHIQWYGKNDVFSPDAMNQSVSFWSADVGVQAGVNAFSYGEAGYWSMLFTGSRLSKSDERNGDFRAVRKAVRWMAESPPQPFLLFLPGMGAHPPYGSPEEFHNKWSAEQARRAAPLRPPYGFNKPKYHSYEEGIPHYRNLTGLSSARMYQLHAAYLGKISYTDWLFGQLLQGIKAAGLESSTAVFFSSDHGDFAGDFHMVEKWPGGADDVLTRVPLYARVPGASFAARGFVSRAPVQLFDIPHTICILAGVNVTGDGSGPFGINYGKSLTPQLLHGEEGELGRFVYAEGGFSSYNELFPGGSDHVEDDPHGMYWPRAQEEMSGGGTGSPKWIMRRNLTHKLVYRPSGQSELYLLKEDPRELRNEWGSQKSIAAQTSLLTGLLDWLVSTSDVTPIHRDSRAVPSYPHPVSKCVV